MEESKVHHIPIGSPIIKNDKYGIERNRLFSFGYWGNRKNIDILLNVANQLKKLITFSLHFAGSDHVFFSGSIEAAMSQNDTSKNSMVKHLGYLTKDHLYAEIGKATAIILPYKSTTGASYALNIAKAFGKPIIAPYDVGFERIISEEGGTINYYDQKDPEMLRNVLISILSDSKKMQIQGEKNRNSIGENTIGNAAIRYLEIMQSLV